MGGVALLARSAGHRVTGCDQGVYPPMSTQLREQGVEITEGYAAGQTRLAPDLYVIGNAISRGNPLLERILDQGLPYISGPQWLAENILAGRWVLGVAGTHGKTTTASMLAWILEYAGMSPSYLIGGVPENFGVSARLTQSAFFVIEADEYDTAFCDKRSKFVHYRPRTLVLNNLEFDHADIFADLAAIQTQFHHLIRTVPQIGGIVTNAGDDHLNQVLQRGLWSKRIDFNIPQGWHLQAEDHDGAFQVWNGARQIGQTRLALSGRHNQLNALAALLAARHVGVLPEHALAALADFQGVKRRMEYKGIVDGVSVYDDFAHHPTAIQATLEGARQRFSSGRLLAVFEPRSNTMKLGTMKSALPRSLALADRAYCYTRDLGWDAAEVFAPCAEKMVLSEQLDALVAAVTREARPGDHILVMSNGGFGGIHQRLLDALSQRDTA